MAETGFSGCVGDLNEVNRAAAMRRKWESVKREVLVPFDIFPLTLKAAEK
jgi:hypothetical protein